MKLPHTHTGTFLRDGLFNASYARDGERELSFLLNGNMYVTAAAAGAATPLLKFNSIELGRRQPP